ncbi:uncharacterized protein BDZ83DRAFT_196689 [Colletotrichum acutatum]|uniref:Uncharacterized protein n=1 Tax=Glomerella acutata TaxID=27357 RepID=A0AAD8UTQ7_GLOAC|nr:uncharacterized protein BDZ83DRAFT_196689 [Colletotrichum acutatum]KAK1727598.1 hypothetical protein BDZ83DRAFT_196689 [Colletotrichum acutatum]
MSATSQFPLATAASASLCNAICVHALTTDSGPYHGKAVPAPLRSSKISPTLKPCLVGLLWHRPLSPFPRNGCSISLLAPLSHLSHRPETIKNSAENSDRDKPWGAWHTEVNLHEPVTTDENPQPYRDPRVQGSMPRHWRGSASVSNSTMVRFFGLLTPQPQHPLASCLSVFWKPWPPTLTRGRRRSPKIYVHRKNRTILFMVAATPRVASGDHHKGYPAHQPSSLARNT